ncbi:MAG: TonB-dependent receptor [Dysgonamonadaceae bacterium]|jgi:iron complex outermembrane receptor protein|nr:TonB-dependent receptor [Dysgonamonadaceae bacterium]
MKQKLFGTRAGYRFRRFVRKAYAAFNSMHKVVNIGVVSGCMLTFAHATETTTQSQISFSEKEMAEKEHELDEIVVSSAKTGLTQNQISKVVSIITQQEIEQQAVNSIPDLLKNVVGLDVRQRGSNGVLSGISVRGGTFEQTAILLDGANLSNPQTAHYSLSFPVNLSDIERIEVIQGPTSLYYGAGAFSGGINIITKQDEKSGLYINTEGGMYDLFHAEIRGNLKTKNTSHSLSTGYKSSSGYIRNSDYSLFNTLWQSRFNLSGSAMNLQLGFNNKEYGANTFFSAEYPNQYDETRSVFASVRGETDTRLKLTPQLYWNRQYNTFHLFRKGTLDIPDWYVAPNYHRTDVFGSNLTGRYQGEYGTTSIGGDIRTEIIHSSVLGKPADKPNGKYLYSDNRTSIGYFMEHTYIYNGFTLGGGVLINYNTAFGERLKFYPRFDIGYWINNSYKLFASWNNAVRVPTFTDLYYKGKTHKGNSDVKPEESESFELGMKHTTYFMTTSLTGFFMKGKNLIDWVKEKPEDLWESRNLTSLNKTGVEINILIQAGEIVPLLASTRLNIGYTFLHQDKKSGGLISNYVLDYLKHKLTGGITHPIYKNITADWQFRWQDREGSYTKYESNRPAYEAEYQPFALLDLKINWKLKDWNVYVSGNNLFNTSYFDLGNIPQPGFVFMGGVKMEL